MDDAVEFLVRHGYWVVLVAVFAEQIGLPLATTPFLIAAGALEPDSCVRRTHGMFGKHGGEQVVLVDLRHPTEIEVDPDSIPGSLSIPAEEIALVVKVLPH